MTTSVDATTVAQTMFEGLNCLGVFLCGPALQKLKPQAQDLLRRWETEYAPVFHKVDLAASGFDPAAFRGGLAKISLLVRQGVDPDNAEQVAALRGAIREVLTAMRFPLPSLAPSDAEVCELHGADCPALLDQSGA